MTARAALIALAALAIAATGCSRMVIGGIPPIADGSTDQSSDDDRDGPIADADADETPPADARPDSRDATADADARDATTDVPMTTDASARDAGDDIATAPDVAPPLPIGIIGGRITMSDTVGVRGAGVAGVLVRLTGAAARNAVSDANGAYTFPNLARGPYTLAVTKDGAVFTPAATTVVLGDGADAGTADGGLPAGVVVTFQCTAPCGTGPAIDPARELFIQDASVLTDARASNATGGPWSFRYLMEQAATTSPNLFAEIWIANLTASGRDMTRLRAQWPTITENTVTLPDLSRAPFELLAIVNGVDAHSAGQGEARLVYGIYDVAGAPSFNPQGRTFTVMFRYALPATTDLPSRQAWASRFHELGATAFGAGYNTKLQALTDVFTRVGARPSSAENPRGSALIAVSINEGFGNNNSPMQLRESRLLSDPVRGTLDLQVATLEQTPDGSLNANPGALPDFLNANPVLVQTGLATLPAALLAEQSSAPNPPVPWSFPSVIGESLRHAFAGQTCVGCHSSEAPSTLFTVFHIFPFDGPASASKSGYVTAVEIPRRASFMQNQLTCSGATCALGAEPMMGPTR